MDKIENETDRAKQGAEIKEFGTPLVPMSPIQIGQHNRANRRAY